MKYKKIIVIILILVVLVFTFFYTTFYAQKNSLRKFGFWISNIDNFIIEEKFTPYFSDYKEERVFARNDNEVLQFIIISNITKQLAEKYASSQFLLFEGMFDQKLPPYPEFLTSATGCAEEFLPLRKKTLLGTYYTVYADERFNHGVCAHDLVRYKAGVGVFYCENLQRAIKISYYVDKTDNFSTIDTLMASFICEDN